MITEKYVVTYNTSSFDVAATKPSPARSTAVQCASQTRRPSLQGVGRETYLQTTETNTVSESYLPPPRMAKPPVQNIERHSLSSSSSQVKRQSAESSTSKQLVYCAEDGEYYLRSTQSTPSAAASSPSQQLGPVVGADATSQKIVYCAEDGHYYRYSTPSLEASSQPTAQSSPSRPNQSTHVTDPTSQKMVYCAEDGHYYRYSAPSVDASAQQPALESYQTSVFQSALLRDASSQQLVYCAEDGEYYLRSTVTASTQPECETIVSSQVGLSYSLGDYVDVKRPTGLWEPAQITGDLTSVTKTKPKDYVEVTYTSGAGTKMIHQSQFAEFIRPSQACFKVGEWVQGRYIDGKWYDAMIKAANPDGCYTVVWEDQAEFDTIKRPPDLRKKDCDNNGAVSQELPDSIPDLQMAIATTASADDSCEDFEMDYRDMDSFEMDKPTSALAVKYLQMASNEFDLLALLPDIVHQLKGSSQAKLHLIDNPGGRNLGLWKVSDVKGNFILKLLASARSRPDVPTDAEKLIELASKRPQIMHDLSVTFPIAIFKCCGLDGKELFDLIVMREAPGIRLADIIAHKVQLGRQDQLFAIMKKVGGFLADFHAAYQMQHADFHCSNTMYDEAADLFTLIDVADMEADAYEGKEDDVTYFNKALMTLQRYYGEDLLLQCGSCVSAGYLERWRAS